MPLTVLDFSPNTLSTHRPVWNYAMICFQSEFFLCVCPCVYVQRRTYRQNLLKRSCIFALARFCTEFILWLGSPLSPVDEAIDLYRRPPIYKQGTEKVSLACCIPPSSQTTCSSACLDKAKYCTLTWLHLLSLHVVDVDVYMLSFSIERTLEKGSFHGFSTFFRDHRMNISHTIKIQVFTWSKFKDRLTPARPVVR